MIDASVIKAASAAAAPNRPQTAAARARRDAMLAMLADLPEPEEYARYLPDRAVCALLGATRTADGWRIQDRSAARLCRNNGLVDMRDLHLTAFGIAVRRVLVAEERDA